MKQKKTFFYRAGFTLIELLLYVSLVSVVVGAMVTFAWGVISAKEKAKTSREVSENLRFASMRIVYELRSASDILSVTASSVCLRQPESGRNPTQLSVVSGKIVVSWGGGSSDCSSLQYSEPLTSTGVQVQSLVFTNTSTGMSKSISFSTTIEALGARSEWQKSQVYSGSVEVRGH